ncbi:hypothetical protein ACIGN6_36250 [Streptomyces sp. NPDC053792]|uniref:hypothetical protein n=1 Tax=Streptomyces sp. NPDC053792 TaxID=3365716 RepID=UPI0037D54D3B
MASVIALLSGALAVPVLAVPTTASAAEACPNTSNTYVLERQPGSPKADTYTDKTLRKYVDFDPMGGGANAPLVSTDFTAKVPWSSRIVATRGGKFYVFGRDGVKSFRDATAEGGSLLEPVETFADTGIPWLGFEKIWASGSYILTINNQGAFEAYFEGGHVMPNGQKTFAPAPGFPGPSDPRVKEIRAAQDVWSVGGATYTLDAGTIRKYTMARFGSAFNAPTVVATGLNDAVQGWSPGAGTVYTATASADYSGLVRGYTGTDTLVSANPTVMSGLFGDVLSDTATCLAPASEAKPVVGTPADDSDLPPAPVEPDPDLAPEPVGPRVVRGVFTLGDGRPAAGMNVLIEASDVAAEHPGSQKPPVLGTTTTAADGSWSLTLPEELPADVAAVAADNGGALNVSATVAGTTSSGVPMIGLDHTVAAPEDPATVQPTAFGVAVSGEQHTTAMIPAAAPDTTFSQPTAAQEATTYAAEQDASSIGAASTAPTWQADNRALESSYTPYIVNGTDVSGQAVTPYSSGTCETLRTALSSRIAYTTVGEGHANWDAYATVDYDSKLSTTVDVAVSTGSTWKASGGVSLGSSVGQTTGYTNQGPNFARQYQIPIQYTKYKYTYYCGGIARSSYQKIIAGRYSVPAGGAVGKMGADVRYKDGYSKFNASPKSHRAYVEPGSYFQLSRGKSVKWNGAASVFGVSLGAATTYDRDHKQRITAGRKAGRHDIWGQNDRVSGNPGLFFSW